MWYGVPAHASEALEEACKDALPHLFAAAPDLLYQLVTMVSPRQLQVVPCAARMSCQAGLSFLPLTLLVARTNAGFSREQSCVKAPFLA